VIRRLASGLIAMAIALSAIPAGASASEAWQAERAFGFYPSLFPAPPGDAVWVHYRLFDSRGARLPTPPVESAELPYQYVEVPPIPGIYRLEAWLEDAAGNRGAPAISTLRFDNAPPAPPVPRAPGRWLLGSEAAVIAIGHPAAPIPLSGIRGYAISLDRGAGSTPCAIPTSCSESETDLDGGIADDSISLGTLPEGTTYVRVLAVSRTGVPSQTRTAAIRVDSTRPYVALAGVPTGWSNEPARVTARAGDDLSGMGAAGPSGPLTAIAVDGAAHSLAAGDQASALVNGSGVHRVQYYARDAAGNLSGGGPGGPPPASAAVRIDEDPPQVAFAAAQDPSEPERIEATVSDPLSGPSSDRGSIALRLAGTRARFEELPTRVAGGRLIAHWESDAYPRGKYEFQATGFDLAGNAATGLNRSRGARMALVNPLKVPVSLESGFAAGRRAWRREKTVRSGPGALFGGRLRRLDRGPAAGQAVAVTETFASGADLQTRKTLVRTRADGTFSVRLPPGPSRDVVAAFAGGRILARTASSKAHLAVRTAIRFKASAAVARIGGGPVVFRGSVHHAGAKGAADGLPVELQFRYPGADWSEFRTVETNSRGRFRYAYRFSDDDSRGVRFQFRAFVPGAKGWPYEPGGSRPVAVTGR
jgi:hypothetical protein